jgi:hypothetical protein
VRRDGQSQIVDAGVDEARRPSPVTSPQISGLVKCDCGDPRTQHTSVRSKHCRAPEIDEDRIFNAILDGVLIEPWHEVAQPSPDKRQQGCGERLSCGDNAREHQSVVLLQM